MNESGANLAATRGGLSQTKAVILTTSGAGPIEESAAAVTENEGGVRRGQAARPAAPIRAGNQMKVELGEMNFGGELSHYLKTCHDPSVRMIQRRYLCPAGHAYVGLGICSRHSNGRSRAYGSTMPLQLDREGLPRHRLLPT